MAASLASLPSIVIVSGSPCRRIAFFRNRSAASLSRCSVSRKSIGLTMFVHGVIPVIPLAFHLNIRLVHPPAHPYRTLVPMERLFQWETIFDDPALDGGVV